MPLELVRKKEKSSLKIFNRFSNVAQYGAAPPATGSMGSNDSSYCKSCKLVLLVFDKFVFFSNCTTVNGCDLCYLLYFVTHFRTIVDRRHELAEKFECKTVTMFQVGN